MHIWRPALSALILALTAALAVGLAVGPAQAFGLSECTRVVRGWNGWEAGHRDLGHGRVAFEERWSAEGVYTDVVVTDCASGETVRTRLREEMVKPRPAFDRRAAGWKVVDRHARRAPALFRIGALAGALGDIGEDTALSVVTTETCACAALYPELRGDKQAYEGA